MTPAEKLTTIAENTPKIYEEGRTKATNEFWDAFTDNGTRTFYEYAFRQSDFEYIRPQKKIAPSGCRSLYMFCDCKNLKKIEKAYVDLSKVTTSYAATVSGHYSVFNGCESIEEIEDIGFPVGGHYMTFASCLKLHTIEVFRVDASCKFTSVFNYCSSLQNITIEGEIGQNGLNFNWSPLTTDSMKSIILHLKNLTGTSDAYNLTIKFSDDSWAALDAEGNTAPHGGTWRDYANSILCWNI